MLKKTFLAAAAILAAVLLAACGDASKKDEKAADAAAVQDTAAVEEAETTEESDMKITSIIEDTKKPEEKTTEKETTTGQEETTTAAAEETTTAGAEEETTTEAAKEEEGRTGIVSADGDGLSLRSGPDASNDVLDLIPDGTELVITEEQDGTVIAVFFQAEPLPPEQILAEDMIVNLLRELLPVSFDRFRFPETDIRVRPFCPHHAAEVVFECRKQGEIIDPGVIPDKLADLSRQGFA